MTGTILGTIADPSGAAVPGAKVTLSNAGTGFNRQTTTDSTGFYEFLSVPVGENYAVEVEVSGFRKSTQTGIKLLVNQRYRADFQLAVGEITQSVEVSASPVQVESTSTQLGDVIEDRKMMNLPLNGRSYIDLLGLQAGVVPITWMAVGGELQRDWARETSAQAFAEILAAHGGGSGIAYAWEMQLLATGARA